MRRLTVGVAVALVFASLAGTAQSQPERLDVYGASSLTDAFRALDSRPRYSFGSSTTLETQIRNGAPADLYAAASPMNTQRLFREGLVQKPVGFTANRLALIVPKSNPAGIRSVADLRRKRVKLVVAGPQVPLGAYTRKVLKRLGLLSVLSKVVSQEPDARAVTGKVALGQADAGFVYVTDARSVRSRVSVIDLPARAQPRVRYEIAVVSGSSNKPAARAWIRRILSARGQAVLKEYGFLPLHGT